MMRYAPKTKPVPPPCGRDCPGRAPGCSAMCCSWMLYQHPGAHLSKAARREARTGAEFRGAAGDRARREESKEGTFVCGKIAPITRESGHRAGSA